MNKLRVPIQLHNAIIECLRYYLSLSSLFFDYPFDEPEIVYRKKGTIAGSALLQKWQIQINLNMLLENKEQFIKEVIPHELAHLIVYKKFGRVKPHGKEWQSVMQHIFHLSAKRTHNFALPEALIRTRHSYLCLCQEHLLTTFRHNKIQKNQVQYHCKKCSSILTLNQNKS